MTQADIKYAEAIENFNVFLKEGTTAANGEFEDYYKELQGLKKFFDTVNWDRIIKESGEDWIADLRKDAAFKAYYKLRSEIDRLEVLVK